MTVLIVGHFNIFVCCHDKSLVKNFLHLIDFLNFVQFVSNSAQEWGHTLELVLAHVLMFLMWKFVMLLFRLHACSV